MMEAGLLCEVKNLVKEGQPPLSDTAMQGIGYKEIIDYLNGNISLDDAVEQIKRYSRNYAKRQITWFKRYENCCRIFVDEYNDFYDIVKIAENEINH